MAISNRNKLLVLLALVAIGLLPSRRATAARSRPDGGDPGLPPDFPIPDPPAGVVVGPGFYWWWCPPEDRDELAVWLGQNRQAVALRKAMGSAQEGAAVVILEVMQPVVWELGGLPSPAPKGLDTTIDDIEHSGAPALSRMGRWIEGMRQTAEDVVRYYDQMFQQWLDSKLRK